MGVAFDGVLHLQLSRWLHKLKLKVKTGMSLSMVEYIGPIYRERDTILTCWLPRNIQQICYSTQMGQHEPCKHVLLLTSVPEDV